MPAVSNLVFLQMLFAPKPFDQKPPDRINRHWVLHGRDDCNWSQADVFRLLNALETLRWVWEIRWDDSWISKLLEGSKLEPASFVSSSEPVESGWPK
jgi:hypothetical protein